MADLYESIPKEQRNDPDISGLYNELFGHRDSLEYAIENKLNERVSLARDLTKVDLSDFEVKVKTVEDSLSDIEAKLRAVKES